MMEFVELCFAGAVLPATVLLILILLYGLMVVAGTVDVDLFDVDFGTDLDIDGATSIGFVALKFLNIGNVPIMIWVTVFGLLWWTLSVLFGAFYDPTIDPQSAWGVPQFILRNVSISVFATKFATEPLRKFFDNKDIYKPHDLIGQQCEVTTYEVTKDSGQAKFATDAAPLLIDVRIDEGEAADGQPEHGPLEDEILSKGDRATIVDFDPETKLYYITKTDIEVSK